MFFIGFAIFPPFTLFNHTPPQVLIYQTTCQAKPIKFLIILHKDHKTLWAKYIIHEKGESLRVACLSTLDNTVNSYKILSSIQIMLLHFLNPTCVYNPPYNLHQKSIPPLQTIFNFLIHHYLFAKLSLQSPLRIPSSIRQQLFTSKQSTPKIFSLPQPFSQCRLRQGNRELE